MNCEQCGYFFQPGQNGLIDQGGLCPNCNRPFRGQPSPTKSDMLHGLDAMPTSTQDDMSGNPLQEGILSDGGWKNRWNRDEAFSSVRTAEFALPGMEDGSAQLPEYDTRFPTHKFLVHADGSVYDAPEPTSHEAIAQQLGDAESHLNAASLGQLFGNGETRFFSNPPGLSASELQHNLTQHYGYPVEVDPNDQGLQAQSQGDRFNIYDQGPQRELDVLQGPARPRFERSPHPDEAEGLLRGGKTSEMMEVPTETEGLALPGTHTIEVPVNPPGLHGEVTNALQQLGVQVDGENITPENIQEIVKHWSGAMPTPDSQWQQNQGQPVMLSHAEEGPLNVARQIVEQGTSAPLRDYMQSREAGHRTNIQIPNGITDNLHQTLGNLKAWVENPYENSALRPYYNKYWKSIRPSFQTPGHIQIGVSDPTMAEVINHVAKTDDLTPLYEYRGVKPPAQSKTAGPAMAILPAAGEALGIGGAEAAGAGAAGAAEGAGGSGMLGGLMSKIPGLSGGIPGMMNGAMGQGLGTKLLQGGAFRTGEDMLGLGQGQQGGGGQQAPVPGGGQAVQPGGMIEPASYYGRTADLETPSSHPEIPLNEDGDSKQKSDDDHHEWQKDYDVNSGGGTDSSHGMFPEGGAGLERFMMLLPLVMHYFNSEESGEQDPLIQGLHQSLEQEHPGYQDKTDPDATNKLIMLIGGGDKGGEEPHDPLMQDTKREETGDDEKPEDAQEKADHLAAQLEDRTSFLPQIQTIPPGIPGLSEPVRNPNEFPGQVPGTMTTANGSCPHCGSVVDTSNANCPQCGATAKALPGHPQPTSSTHTAGQGPQTDEQKAAVAQLLQESGRGEEIPIMIVQPQEYANELAEIQQKDPPPQPEDAGLNATPPEPAQEQAPPGATMPVPGMSQQMMGAVLRYSADPQTPNCPDCGSHTTGLEGDDGHCRCSSCGHEWDVGVTKTGHDDPDATFGGANEWPHATVPNPYAGQQLGGPPCPQCGEPVGDWSGEGPTAQADFCHNCGYGLDDPRSLDEYYEDQRGLPSDYEPEGAYYDRPDRQARVADHHHEHDDVPGVEPSTAPAADQQLPEDLRQEQDSSHSWLDSQGAPLKVGQQYEMYSGKYDIPDPIRVDAVKPQAIVYTILGEHGLEHQTEVTREEADLEQYSFEPSAMGDDAELQPDPQISQDMPDTAAPGDKTDLSTPHMMMSSHDIAMMEHEPIDPELAWLKQADTQEPSLREREMAGVQAANEEDHNDPELAWLKGRTAGAKMTPWEQNQFVTESGVARNADKLNLAGTHYEDAEDEQFLFGF